MTEAEQTAEEMIAEFRTITERMFNIINKSDIAIKSAIKACDRIINVCQEVDNNAYDEEKLIERKIKHYEEVKQILESKL